ncbi:MAG: ribonuclease P protein component [Lawsonibacter sp.]|nr:ribonuclease P protein component [Lawsonibacter sp.]
MKYTVPLKQNHEFRRLYNKGKSTVSPYFVIYCRKTGRPVNRLGITTGVKLGNAVKRNRARRRIRELYRTHEQKLSAGYDIVVVARTRVIYGRFSDLERSFVQQMKKLGLILPKDKVFSPGTQSTGKPVVCGPKGDKSQ